MKTFKEKDPAHIPNESVKYTHGGTVGKVYDPSINKKIIGVLFKCDDTGDSEVFVMDNNSGLYCGWHMFVSAISNIIESLFK